MDEQEDFSSKTVLLLLVIAILVSIFGTWSVIHYTSEVKAAAQTEQPQASGDTDAKARVSLTIVQPANDTSEPSTQTTGQETDTQG